MFGLDAFLVTTLIHHRNDQLARRCQRAEVRFDVESLDQPDRNVEIPMG